MNAKADIDSSWYPVGIYYQVNRYNLATSTSIVMSAMNSDRAAMAYAGSLGMYCFFSYKKMYLFSV